MDHEADAPVPAHEPKVDIQFGPTKPVTPQGTERATWGGKVEFLLSCIGYAVGLGNVWRFPHLCYSNGGGAFLIPYTLMLALLGLPLFFLEMALGQFASLGPISVWRLCPLFKGVGYTTTIISGIVSVYYNVIIAYTLFYFFASFTSNLPWSHCGHDWNTEHCRETARRDHFETMHNLSNIMSVNFTSSDALSNDSNSNNFTNSSSLNATEFYVKPKSPAEEYWERYVLNMSDGIHHMGGVEWRLVLCLLLAWTIVFLCILKGIKSSGKVVYFTATFPYVILVILFFRGVTLPGAGEGIKFYLRPDFHKMAHAKVWKDAAVQILYSLGPGFGALLTMASYSKFNNNCYRDALIVPFINCCTSIFAGFVIFSVLGFMAHKNHVEVSHVVDSGVGLAFIAYPEALSMMPAAPFWSLCFFFMLFTLGLDSQFAGMECIVTAFVDEFEFVRAHKKKFTLSLCFLLFLLGLPCVAQGGTYVIELIDKYSTAFPLLFVTGTECLVISWIYGYRRFGGDIKMMLGHHPGRYWVVCWAGVTPAVIGFILVAMCVEYDGIVFHGYRYPGWAEALGWLLVIGSLIMIPVWMVVQLWLKVGSCQTLRWILTGPTALKTLNLRSLVEPTDQWGPALQANRIRHNSIQSSDKNVNTGESDVEAIVSYSSGYGSPNESYI